MAEMCFRNNTHPENSVASYSDVVCYIVNSTPEILLYVCFVYSNFQDYYQQLQDKV